MSAVRNFLITLLVALLIFGLVAFGILEFATSAFSSVDDEENGGQTSENSGTSEPEIIVPPDVFEAVQSQSFTVLFVGSDYLPSVYDDYEYADKTPDGFDGEVREKETDTLILVRINKETGECIYCPIPVNTKIKIDGHDATLEKLYARKGIEVLKEQVTYLTGIPVDFHAIVEIDALSSIIDELGGIQFYVPVDMNYVDLSAGLEINLKAGVQILDGKNALDMLRFFKYKDGDVSRRKTASDFLKALVNKVLTDIPMKEAAIAYSKYYQFIDTNFTLEDLEELASLIYLYPQMSVKDYTYPGKVITENGIDYFSADVQNARKYFDKYKFKG